ncbi:hypothetical protein MRX96_010784 [Rhipicephalus microplus]
MRAIAFLLCVFLVTWAFIETDAKRGKRTTATMRTTTGRGHRAAGAVVRAKTTTRKHKRKSSTTQRKTTPGHRSDEDD